MRIVPVITAIIVAAFLYGIIIQRDTVLEFAQQLGSSEDTSEPSPENVAAAAPDSEAEDDTADAPQIVRVFAMHSVAREVDSAVILRGETEALRQVEVQAETSGRIISEPLRSGSFVDAGQTLCEIDPGTRLATLSEAKAGLAEAMAQRPTTEARIPEADAKLEEARAALEEAQVNANVANRLNEDGFASETRVKSATAAVRSAEAAIVSAEAGVKSATAGLNSLEAAIESAQAAVIRAQTDIDRLTITAPFAGVLESDTAELGSLLQSAAGNAVCATILQLNPIKLVGYVPEAQIGRVNLGAMAGARMTDGQQVVGEVTFVSRSADPVTRTFRVDIEVDNESLSLRDGQTAEIAIGAEGAMAHLLPGSTLTLNDEGALGVRTVTEDSTVAFMPVTLLRDTRDGVLVGGLPDQVNVITVGQEYVIDGVRVAPTYEEITQ